MKIGNLFLSAMVVLSMDAYAAQKSRDIILQGNLINEDTKKSVDFGTVYVLEAKKKVTSLNNGYYKISIGKPGSYTFVIVSDGMTTLRTKVNVDGDMTRNFILKPLTSKGGTITITGDRDLQKVSRHTMKREQMKKVPASLGDSVSALTSLPGVIRTGGDLFGPIVIRGGDTRGVRYLIDDIPIYAPMHYGGLHSVINSNLIDEIDLIASAFPAEFGSATSAIISINTVDDVKTFGGYSDLSILSASALIQSPIQKTDKGGITIGSPLSREYKEGKNVGYGIASGRIGYIDFIVLPLLKAVTGESIGVVPRYWDYQAKVKYRFGTAHSVTILCIGSRDYLKYVSRYNYESGQDPLTAGLRAKLDESNHNQGIYYVFRPNERFQNKLTVYSSLRNYTVGTQLPSPGVSLALSKVTISTDPYIFGAKDNFKVEAVKKILEVRGGAEYDMYYFKARGNTVGVTGDSSTRDISQNGSFIPIPLKYNIINHTVGGFVETKFTIAGLTILPGFRTDYLHRIGTATWDPRGMISYSFTFGLTLSAAAGKYSNFIQTNPAYFTLYPQYSRIGKELKPEWAFHRVFGAEQTIQSFKIKVEGYYNDFYDLMRRYIHFAKNGKPVEIMNSGRIKSYGAEIMLQKDTKENDTGLFGWISYTYTRSRYKSGLPFYPGLYGISYNQIGDSYGNRWINYSYEQNHSFKVILGYNWGKHMLTGKFQLFSSTPYTPIISGQQDLNYLSTTGGARYYPIDGKPNSRHFPINHRLDLRYSMKRNYSWGHVSWYVEVINVYNYRPIVTERWNYNLPYFQIPGLHSRNPQRSSYSNQLALIPNFGVEVKF